MHRIIPALLLTSTLLAQQTPQPPAQTFRSTADIVPLFVTATDKSGRLVTDLVRDEFQVLDNGKAQPIVVFDKSPQPIRLIVMIDVSGSMADRLPLLRLACEALFRQLGPDDLARVGTFGKEIEISPQFTRDAATLSAWLPETVAPDQPTPLWYAVDKAIGELMSAPAGRRVLMVLSDSKDSGPPKFGLRFLSPIEIRERAQREDVMIYGVGVYGSLGAARRSGAATIGGMLASTFPDPGLSTVAQDSGGGYIELRGRDDLAATFGRVADELHQQYLLGFAPPARDGKTHKVEVKPTRKDIRIRVRKTYVAPRAEK
jgi:Ca-activated chloride channel family protein